MYQNRRSQVRRCRNPAVSGEFGPGGSCCGGAIGEILNGMAIIRNLQESNIITKIAWLMLCLGLMTGCALDMRNQPRYETFEKSTFFQKSNTLVGYAYPKRSLS